MSRGKVSRFFSSFEEDEEEEGGGGGGVVRASLCADPGSPLLGNTQRGVGTFSPRGSPSSHQPRRAESSRTGPRRLAHRRVRQKGTPSPLRIFQLAKNKPGSRGVFPVEPPRRYPGCLSATSPACW